MKSLILVLVIIAMLIRIAIVTKDSFDYEKERGLLQKSPKSNVVIIPISDTAVAYLPENYSHRNFMQLKKASSLRTLNPLAFKFATKDKDKERWKLSTIKFHGKLIDQLQGPIPNANLEIIVRYRSGGSGLFMAGRSPDHVYLVNAKTNKNGYFSIDKVVGDEFSINTISVDGYTFKKEHVGQLFGRRKNNIKTSKDNPYNLKAWKINSDTENVVDIFLSANSKLIPDGSIYSTDVVLKSEAQFFTDGDGKEILVSITREWDAEIANVRSSYRVSLNIKNGGFIETSDLYPYLAPETGYVSSVSLDMDRERDGIPEWKGGKFEKNYYVKLNEGDKFGYIKLRGNPFFRESFASLGISGKFNTDGGRELLSTSDIKINEKRFKSRYER